MFYGFWEKALPVEIFSGDCLFWAISELLKRAEAHGIKAVPKEHAGIITPPLWNWTQLFPWAFNNFLAVFVPHSGCYSKGKQVASNDMSIHFPQRRCLKFDSKKRTEAEPMMYVSNRNLS